MAWHPRILNAGYQTVFGVAIDMADIAGWTFILTDPALGSGTSRSTSSNGTLGCGTWTTRIFAICNSDYIRPNVRATQSALTSVLDAHQGS
jgi:hypothetical protein